MPHPKVLSLSGAAPALYLRPGRNDHRVLAEVVAEGSAKLDGVVISAAARDRHKELREIATGRGIETILDCHVMELSTPAGQLRKSLTNLPWGAVAQLAARRQTASLVIDATQEMASMIREHSFSAVLSPTHFLETPDEEWGSLDSDFTWQLRKALDTLGLASVPIYYGLAIPTSLLHRGGDLARVIARLHELPIDALWLRVHPFGSNSSGSSLGRYVAACQDLHALGIPIIGGHAGAAGVALTAFGAIGGVESGVTSGEQFNYRRLQKPARGGKGFAPAPRVYVHQLGAFVTRRQAEQLFSVRSMKSRLGCSDTSCCRRGVVDTIANPRRHFILQRGEELARLAQVPALMRAPVYMDEFLRPATDLAGRAVSAVGTLRATHQRLESWRYALGKLAAESQVRTYALAPGGGRISLKRRLQG